MFVVLLALALLGLAHGLLVAALAEAAASRAGVRLLEAHAAAEAGVHNTLRRPGGAWLDTLHVGGAGEVGPWPLGRASARARVRRLAPEAWLVEGEALAGGRPVARSGRLAWAADPLVRVTALGGVLNAPAAVAWTLPGSVDASRPAVAAPPLRAADCAPWVAELAAQQASRPLAPVATLADTVGGPGLGRLDFATLLESADVRVSGAGTPVPVVAGGACVRGAPWGWGDPDNPLLPCGAHLPLRGAEGDLMVVGGVGQGVLVVDGDLTLTAAARYYGVVIVRGTLVVEAGARLEGLALSGSGGAVAAGAGVTGSTCWAARALAAHRPRLGGLLAVPGVGPIGPL